MGLLEPQNWSFPVPIAYGPGRIGDVGARACAAGMTRPLVVTDRGSRALPFVARTLDCLVEAGLTPMLFGEISPNPREADVAAGAAAFRAGGCDGVIGIGGGSGMDGAKAIALTATSNVELWDFEFERPPPRLRCAPPPLIAVPTTAGTGAETEGTAMITDSAQAMKFCVWHPNFRPVAAILDPQLTYGLPRALTAWTGLDALTHAIEAHAVPSFHPLADGAALEGLRLVWRWLPEAVARPDAPEARAGMLAGACLAGVAFLKGLGLVHAISHMVGAEYETHHGLTNAVLLPAVLRFCAAEMEVRALTQAMGLAADTPDALHGAICDLLDRLDIPQGLGALGVPPEAAPRLAAKAMRDSAASTSPRRASLGELEDLIAEAIVAAR